MSSQEAPAGLGIKQRVGGGRLGDGYGREDTAVVCCRAVNETVIGFGGSEVEVKICS